MGLITLSFAHAHRVIRLLPVDIHTTPAAFIEGSSLSQKGEEPGNLSQSSTLLSVPLHITLYATIPALLYPYCEGSDGYPAAKG
jgi:hypothetical protein